MSWAATIAARRRVYDSVDLEERSAAVAQVTGQKWSHTSSRCCHEA